MNFKPILTFYSLFNGLYGEDFLSFVAGNCSDKETPDYYFNIGVITILSAVLLTLVFYYLMGNNDLYKLRHYLIILGANSVIAFIIGQVVFNSAKNSSYSCESFRQEGFWGIFNFSMINAVYALILFLMVSGLMQLLRLGSSNTRHIPFNFNKKKS